MGNEQTNKELQKEEEEEKKNKESRKVK